MAKRGTCKEDDVSSYITFSSNKLCAETGDERKYKVFIIGSPNVGKSSLRNIMEGQEFKEDIERSRGVNAAHFELTFKGEVIHICLYDTAGLENDKNFFSRYIENTDCLIMTYAIDNKSSLDDIIYKWLPGVMEKTTCSQTVKHIQILGTKADEKPGWTIDHDFGALEKKYGVPIFSNECSSKTGANVSTFFWTMVKELTLHPPAKVPPEPSSCEIL